jgi:hypothetical protein
VALTWRVVQWTTAVQQVEWDVPPCAIHRQGAYWKGRMMSAKLRVPLEATRWCPEWSKSTRERVWPRRPQKILDTDELSHEIIWKSLYQIWLLCSWSLCAMIKIKRAKSIWPQVRRRFG